MDLSFWRRKGRREECPRQRIVALREGAPSGTPWGEAPGNRMDPVQSPGTVYNGRAKIGRRSERISGVMVPGGPESRTEIGSFHRPRRWLAFEGRSET
jgi:hypothetical protein